MQIPRMAAVFTAASVAFFQTDGRAEWTEQQTAVNDYLYGMHCRSDQRVYAVGWGASPGGVILRTIDGGENWSDTIPLDRSYLFDVKFLDDDFGMACGYDGFERTALILTTIDGGESWFPRTFDQSFGFYVLQFPSAGVGYVCGYGGTILKTSDGGNEWARTNTGTNWVFRWMQFLNDTTGYAVAGSNFNNPSRIYKTVDGENWGLVKDFAGRFVIGSISFSDVDSGVAVGNDGNEAIYRTTDGGANWTRVYSTAVREVLQTVAMNGNNGWAAGGAGRIHRTEDGGVSWRLDATLDGAPLLMASAAFGNSAFVGGEGGRVFKFELANSSPVEADPSLPGGIRLLSSYPNPFNSSSTLRFEINRPGMVSAAILDGAGRQVRAFRERFFEEGGHSLFIDGEGLPAGRYTIFLRSGSESRTGTATLLK